MATIRQRQAFNKIIENHGNVMKSMREVGYSPNTVINPSNLTDSIGFQELCEEYGLTDDFLIKALVSDIKNKPKNRKAELELGFKVKQRLVEDKTPKGLQLPTPITNIFVQNVFNNDKHEGDSEVKEED